MITNANSATVFDSAERTAQNVCVKRRVAGLPSVARSASSALPPKSGLGAALWCLAGAAHSNGHVDISRAHKRSHVLPAEASR